MARKKIKDWSATFQEFSDSGLDVAGFCKSKGIHPNTYYKNRKKYQSEEICLVKLKPVAVTRQQKIEVESNGFIITIPDDVDSQLLEKVLQAVRAIL